MPELQNRLVWSNSRNNSLQKCPRLYYYSHYQMWNGWRKDATPDQKIAYRLKQMQSIPAFAGHIVHRVIKQVLRNYRDHGRVCTVDEAAGWAAERWQQGLDESAGGEWLNSPKKFLCLLEDYYGDPRCLSQMEKYGRRIRACIESFFVSETWHQLQQSKTSNWLALDEENFDESMIQISGVPCFMVVDFCYDLKSTKKASAQCRIFDWKTGKPRLADEQQIAYYALYAQAKWGFEADQVVAHLVYLNQGDEARVEITPEMLEDAQANIRDSYAHMRSLLSDEASSTPLDISSFPVTQDASNCRYCSFQEICTDRIPLPVLNGDEIPGPPGDHFA